MTRQAKVTLATWLYWQAMYRIAARYHTEDEVTAQANAIGWASR